VLRDDFLKFCSGKVIPYLLPPLHVCARARNSRGMRLDRAKAAQIHLPSLLFCDIRSHSGDWKCKVCTRFTDISHLIR
jgi:hypothetical protein